MKRKPTLQARLTQAEQLTNGLTDVVKAQKVVINELLDTVVKRNGRVKELEAEAQKQKQKPT